MIDLSKISYLLFDIEGTIAPISFVHEVLFPYSQKHLVEFLKNNSLDEVLFNNLKAENEKDTKEDKYHKTIVSLDDTIEYLQFLIKVDRKSPSLKEIQGRIWKFGYESGELKSTIFSDAIEFFHKYSKDKKLGIYSSGSMLAQKLILQYSESGDLTSLFSNYFDTEVGGKRESKSYSTIATRLGLAPEKILFFTDILEEGIAAKNSKFFVYLVSRVGNSPIQKDSDFPIIENFLRLE
ncbi:MAG: acireductone synthase [Leptospiraceae bacterium]|nr:acireductone synthase [Leptospiraceae bacterium]